MGLPKMDILLSSKSGKSNCKTFKGSAVLEIIEDGLPVSKVAQKNRYQLQSPTQVERAV